MTITRQVLRQLSLFFWGCALSGVLLLAAGCVPNAMLRRQGMEAFEAGDVNWADNRFSYAVRQDATDWKSQYYLGRVRIMQNRPLEAALHLEKALSLRDHDPETQDILDALAEALYMQGQPVRLHAMLKKAVYDYGTIRDYLRQGRYLAKTGDADGAKVAYRKAAKFAPAKDPEPFLEIADYYESMGDRQNTIDALRRAYAASPGSRRISARLRQYGIVPGPTVGLPPEGESADQPPEMPPLEPETQTDPQMTSPESSAP